jgi:Flp pilus assembly protein TadG
MEASAMSNLVEGFANRLRKFVRDHGGSASLFNVIASIPIVAAGGMAIDYSRTTRAKSELQEIADAAALAAGARKHINGESTASKLAARALIASKYLNHGIPRIADLEVIGSPVISVGPNTVDVAVTGRVKGTFLNILNALPDASSLLDDEGGGSESKDKSHDFDFTVTTKVGYLRDSYICLLALDPKAKEAIFFQGNSEFTATCSVQANSDNEVAIRTWGNAYAQADSFCAVGGWSGSGFYPDPLGGCKTKKEPYAGMALPTPDASCPASFTNVVVKNTTANLTPGTYCGGLKVRTHGVANLAPGLYIIKDGTLEVDSQSTLSAPSGVVFYLTGNSSVIDIASGAAVTIVAPNNVTALPSTAAYKGFAIMQDRTTAVLATNTISSKGDVNITGGIYTPSQNLIIWANGDMNVESKYFPMIVNSFQMNGNATLHVRLDYSEVSLDDPILLKAPAKVFVSK